MNVFFCLIAPGVTDRIFASLQIQVSEQVHKIFKTLGQELFHKMFNESFSLVHTALAMWLTYLVMSRCLVSSLRVRHITSLVSRLI